MKHSVLHRQGADFGPEALAPAGSGGSGSPREQQPTLDRPSPPPLSSSASGGKQQQQQHPLMAESWTAFHADLGQPGWVDALAAHGFDRQRPAVWVAEGLLVYLSEAEALRLLTDMAGGMGLAVAAAAAAASCVVHANHWRAQVVQGGAWMPWIGQGMHSHPPAAAASAPGSTLIAHNCSDELMALLGEGPVDYPPFAPELVATWQFGLPLDPGEVRCGRHRLRVLESTRGFCSCRSWLHALRGRPCRHLCPSLLPSRSARPACLPAGAGGAGVAAAAGADAGGDRAGAVQRGARGALRL